MLGVTAGPTPDPVAVAIEGSRQALQPWLNQNLRCQNLVRGGGSFQQWFTADGRVFIAGTLEPASLTFEQFNDFGATWEPTEDGFRLTQANSSFEDWVIGDDEISTIWTQEAGQRNCFMREA